MTVGKRYPLRFPSYPPIRPLGQGLRKPVCNNEKVMELTDKRTIPATVVTLDICLHNLIIGCGHLGIDDSLKSSYGTDEMSDELERTVRPYVVEKLFELYSVWERIGSLFRRLSISSRKRLFEGESEQITAGQSTLLSWRETQTTKSKGETKIQLPHGTQSRRNRLWRDLKKKSCLKKKNFQHPWI